MKVRLESNFNSVFLKKALSQKDKISTVDDGGFGLATSNIFNKELRTKNDFNEIITLINKYKIIQECYQKAQHYINLASNSLSVFKDSEEKNILKRLTSFSLSRNF